MKTGSLRSKFKPQQADLAQMSWTERRLFTITMGFTIPSLHNWIRRHYRPKANECAHLRVDFSTNRSFLFTSQEWLRVNSSLILVNWFIIHQVPLAPYTLHPAMFSVKPGATAGSGAMVTKLRWSLLYQRTCLGTVYPSLPPEKRGFPVKSCRFGIVGGAPIVWIYCHSNEPFDVYAAMMIVQMITTSQFLYIFSAVQCSSPHKIGTGDSDSELQISW